MQVGSPNGITKASPISRTGDKLLDVIRETFKMIRKSAIFLKKNIPN